MSNENLLEVRDLTKYFELASERRFLGAKRTVKAVDGINFTLKQGETLGLVGESGCGKSTLGRTLLKLYEPTSGSIFFEGEEITNFSPRKMKSLRRKMQIIFQDPYSSLNPRQSVGEIIAAPFRVHTSDTNL
ncbi:MAG: hypothetical protein RL287_513, partial [Actinomycetota bacterium]